MFLLGQYKKCMTYNRSVWWLRSKRVRLEYVMKGCSLFLMTCEDKEHGLGQRTWLGTKNMAWDKEHGLGQRTWLGTKTCEDKEHGLGQRTWLGTKNMAWDKEHGLGQRT